MAYRGRYQLGDFVPLTVICTNAQGSPTLPDLTPRARIFDPTGLHTSDYLMPVIDRYAAPGLFHYPLPLGATFNTLGNWRVVYTWSVGSYTGETEDTFEVVPGGDGRGTVISSYFYHRPDADYIVFQTDNGTLTGLVTGGEILYGRNPRI